MDNEWTEERIGRLRSLAFKLWTADWSEETKAELRASGEDLYNMTNAFKALVTEREFLIGEIERIRPGHLKVMR